MVSMGPSISPTWLSLAVWRKNHAGCSKRRDFSPAQPWRLLHPPALSLSRQPLRPGTHLVRKPIHISAANNLRFTAPGSDARTKLADFSASCQEPVRHCLRGEAKEMRPDSRPQACENRRRIPGNTLRIFSGRERRRWSQIIRQQ